MFKKYLKITGICVALISLSALCSANPLSGILSIFQRDLVVHVLYQDHKNLIQGSEVYFAEDPGGDKFLIGEVKRIALVDPGMSRVELIIDKKHKDRLYESTRFVLMSGFFTENSKPYVVAVPLLNASGSVPLKSGTTVKGFTFLEYKFAAAGEELEKILGSLKTQNDELLEQIERYIENFNTEAFQKRMEDLINEISKFSAEQKEFFKKEILPSLRQAYESILEKLEKQNDTGKSKELEKQLMEIENMVDA